MAPVTAAEIQRVFTGNAARGSGLFEWYSKLETAGLLRIDVETYVPVDVPEPQLRTRESDQHRRLVQQAGVLFRDEKRVGFEFIGYGKADYATEVRLIECGHTNPVKLMRAWALGYRLFTVLPFVEHVAFTFQPIGSTWPLTPVKPAKSHHGNRLLAR